MDLEEAQKVLESLEELSPDMYNFSWGPTMKFAKNRKKEAIKIIKKYIKKLKEKNV